MREKIANKHSSSTSYDFPVASRLSTVWAANEARRCADLGQMETAVLLGTAYRVVTPATGAVVMELQSDYEYQDLHRNFYSVVSAKAHASAEAGNGAGEGGNGTAEPEFVLAFGENKKQAPMPSAAPSRIRSRRAMDKFDNESRSSGLVPPPPPAVPIASSADAAAGIAMPAMKAASSRAPRTDAVASDDAFAVAPATESTAMPSLQGATNGSIGPEGLDAAFLTGVNTAGTVRVNSLARLETMLNLIVLSMQGLSIAYGALNLFQGFFLPNTRTSATRKLLLGSALLLIGMCIPEAFNYLFGMARDANLFS